MAPAAVYNWTGFYIGGNIGGGWADQGSVELAPGTAHFRPAPCLPGKI